MQFRSITIFFNRAHPSVATLACPKMLQLLIAFHFWKLINRPWLTKLKNGFVFHCLPNDVTWYVLFEWLASVADLSSLDIAVCNHALRPCFLDVLKGSRPNANPSNCTVPYFTWLQRRGMFASSSMRMQAKNALQITAVDPVLRTMKELWLSADTNPLIDQKHLYESKMFTLFSNCPSLLALCLDHLHPDLLQWVVIGAARANTQLTSLEVINTRYYTDEISLLIMLRIWGMQLTQLKISAAFGLTDVTLQALTCYCPNLQSWEFSCMSSKYSREGLQRVLCALSNNLTRLALVDDPDQLVDLALLQQVLPHLSALRSVALPSSCGGYALLDELVQHCRLLEIVEVQDLFRLCLDEKNGNLLTVHNIYATVTPLPYRIHKLEVGCPNVHLHPLLCCAVLLVAIRLLGQQLLVITCNGHIYTAMLEAVALHCPKLIGLHCRPCHGCGYCEGVLMIAERFNKQLTELTVSHCLDMTDASMVRVLQLCPNVRALELSHCDGLSEEITLSNLRSIFCPMLARTKPIL